MKDNVTKNDLVARTLWQVETDLAGAPSLDDLAGALGVSRYHLTRAFALRTGQSLMAYVRARRLTLAARALARPGASVIEAGLEAGYDSAPGFTRAFRSRFRCAPSTFRACPDLTRLTLQEPLVMTPTSKTVTPRIVDFPGQVIAGMSERFTMETRQAIPGFWARTVEVHGPAMMGHETFGACWDFDEDDGFSYFIGADTSVLSGEDGIDTLTLPAGAYAVFDHDGHIATIGDTWNAVFSVWAPEQKDWKIAGSPEFERYAKDFNPAKPGGVAIWIPVRPA